jgi:hypothetical protein
VRQLTEFLYQALHTEFGIIVRTTGDTKVLRQNFYKARKAANDPQLDVLTFSFYPANPKQELCIIKRPDKTHETGEEDT